VTSKITVHVATEYYTNKGKVFSPPPFELDITTEVSKPFDFHQVAIRTIYI